MKFIVALLVAFLAVAAAFAPARYVVVS